MRIVSAASFSGGTTQFTKPRCRFRIETIRQKDHLHGFFVPDEPRQEISAAPIRTGTDARVRKCEARIRASDANICRAHQNRPSNCPVYAR